MYAKLLKDRHGTQTSNTLQHFAYMLPLGGTVERQTNLKTPSPHDVICPKTREQIGHP